MHNFFVFIGAVLLAILVGLILLAIFFIIVGTLMTVEEQHNNPYLLVICLVTGSTIAMSMIATGTWFYVRCEKRWWT